MNYKKKKLKIENLQKMEVIGRGKSSIVHLAQYDEDKKHWAVKIFKKMDLVKKNLVKRLSWELRIFSNLNSNLFPTMHGTCQTNSEFWLVMEYVPGGDFYFWESHMENISLTAGCFYIGQIVLMLEYLHAKNIIYRDLKPENLLVGADGYLRLIDFGSATVVGSRLEKTYTICGTPEFFSPEMLLKRGHTISVDYWALGVFVYEIFAKKGPFFDEDPMKLYLKTLKTEYSFPENFPEKAKGLVRGCLLKDPMQRLGMLKNGIMDIKNQNLFQGFCWNDLISKKLSPPVLPKVKNDKDTTNFPEIKVSNSPSIDLPESADRFRDW